jgi:hypothetical protein
MGKIPSRRPVVFLLLALSALAGGSDAQEIRWRPELRKAAAEAERDRKPLLIWAMDGHPLAAT